MGHSIAILIGNTTYKRQATLECCSEDVNRMHSLLLKTEKFTQIIDIVDKPVSSAKNTIRELAEFEGEIEEVFFYFSGHGLSNSDDFFMCFSEFNEASPNTSGLSRTSAFELIRLFDAEVSVVVIDACEAGRNLIKHDSPPLGRALKSGFTNFVQMSSCTENQFSMAGKEVSVFTDAFIKACVQKEAGVVFYSDIENALRDAFLNDTDQTPHFIRQSTSQEKFCNDATRLSSIRQSYFAQESEGLSADDSPEPISSFALAKVAIEAIEKDVPSESSAQNFINSCFEAVIRKSSSSSDLEEYFKTRTVSYDEYDYVDNKKSVVSLLKRRGDSDSFVVGKVERKKRQTPYSLSMMLATYGMPDEYDEIYTISNNCGLSAIHVGIYFESNYLSLKRLFSEIVFLPRLTECLILTRDSKQPRSSWGTFADEENKNKWKWSHHAWTDDPTAVANDYLSDPYLIATNYIQSFAENKNL